MKNFVKFNVILFILLFAVTVFTAETSHAAKNVIFLIGDGMGVEHIGVMLSNRKGRDLGQSAIEKLMASGNSGLVMTSSKGYATTDSAAGGTALACGSKTLTDVISLDSMGYELSSSFKIARRIGKKTGLISTHKITDATPAVFYANQYTRYNSNEIARELLESGVDVALGGGIQDFLPKSFVISDSYPIMKTKGTWNDKGQRKDNRNLVEEFIRSQYKFVHTKEELNAIDHKHTKKLIGLFAPYNLSLEIDRIMQMKHEPSLAEMTDKAIKILHNSPKGFFLMVEGASIDSASHCNDGAAMLGEMEAFSDAVELCVNYAKKHGDTLVIVTADHATGGPGFAYKFLRREKVVKPFADNKKWIEKYDYTSHLSAARLSKQKLSNNTLVQMAKKDPVKLHTLIQKYTPWKFTLKNAKEVFAKVPPKKGPIPEDGWSGYRLSLSHIFSGRISKLVSDQSGLVWSTGTHTSTPVPVMAYGPGAKHVRGFHENAWIGEFIKNAVKK